MATATTIMTLGQWDRKMEVPLSRAIAVSQDVFKKSASKICYEALWYMTQSAGKLTPMGAKNREVSANPVFRHLLKAGDGPATYQQARRNGLDVRPFFRFFANKLGQRKNRMIYGNEKAPLAKINRRGLAKKSWFWGWGKESRTAIEGVTTVDSIISNSANMAGYILRNRLAYILKIMPSGWAREVERKATNRIMGKARDNMERDFKRQAERAA